MIQLSAGYCDDQTQLLSLWTRLLDVILAVLEGLVRRPAPPSVHLALLLLKVRNSLLCKHLDGYSQYSDQVGEDMQ